MRKKTYLLQVLFVLLIFSCTPADAWFKSGSVRKSVVKIYATIQRENYDMPWQGGNTGGGTGSGFIIHGKRILTNAHVASDSRFLEVQKDGDPTRYNARVAYIAHDCDLALLSVDDPSFFDNTTPLEFSTDMPTLNDEVFVLGFPMGGSRLSITKGIVSRIDYSIYTHSGIDQHLVLQVDAAINPGNSGGPVVFKNHVVGVAFQGMTWADNIGYGIPLPVIQHFLDDIRDGEYDGYPELGLQPFNTRNAALRKDLMMKDGTTGIAVSYVDPLYSAANYIQPKDVLINIDGYPIANDGTVMLNGETTDFSELVERKQTGESIKCEILRNGSNLVVNIPLIAPHDPFIYRNTYDVSPRYFIKGGLIFSPLCIEILKNVAGGNLKENGHQLLYASEFAKMDGLYKDRKEFVVLTGRLNHIANTYSDSYINGIVETVNNIHISELSDLKTAFSKPEYGSHVITFMEMDDFLVMDADATSVADSIIQKQYAIQNLYRLEDKP